MSTELPGTCESSRTTARLIPIVAAHASGFVHAANKKLVLLPRLASSVAMLRIS